MYNLVLRLIQLFNRFDGDVIVNDNNKSSLSTVLMFLPGIYEIKQMHTILTNAMNL